MQWREARAKIEATEGLITKNEARCLYELARSCGGVIVEIGSWKGKSTVSLALGSRDGSRGKVFAVDPHLGTYDDFTGLYTPLGTEEAFRDNIKRAGVADTVEALVMKSEEAARGWNRPISLLWIDGAHDYENVRLDFSLWEPHLIPGGIICFHDALYCGAHPWRPFPGIKTIVINKIAKSGRFTGIQFCDSIVYATKAVPASLADSLLKWWRLLTYRVLLAVCFPLMTLGVSLLIKTGLFRPAKLIKDKVLRVVRKD